VHKIIEFFFLPIQDLAQVWGLVFATLVLTIFALLIYKYTSNQKEIKKAKEKIKAHFLEVFLFIDEPILIIKAQVRIMVNGLKYLGYALIPLLIMFLPVLLVLVNMEHRYHYRPFKPGENFLLKVKLKKQIPNWQDAIFIQPSEELRMTSPPLRFLYQESKGETYPEIDYRLQVIREGAHPIILRLAGKEKIKLTVLAEAQRASRLVTVEGSGFSLNFWHPSSGLVPKQSLIHSIEITYPKSELNLFGWESYWGWQFLVLMFIFAFALKPVIRVEF